MVKCKDCLKEISNYLEGGLSEDLRRDLEAHLRGCSHCKVVFDTTQRTIELYCDGKLFPLPQEVRSRLHGALRRRWEQERP